MKKLIFFLCCIIFGITSYQAVKEFETSQVQSFNQTLTNDSYLIEIEQGNPNISNEENYQILQDFSNENNTNIQRISYEKDFIGQDVTVYYVGLGDKNTYLENINIHSGDFINDNIEQFVSNVQTEDENQTGVIDLFYNKSPIEIRPLLYASRIKDIRGTYTISDKENWDLLVEELAQKEISASFSIKTSEDLLSEYPYSEMMYQTIAIVCLLIGLAIAYDLINEYKVIAIKSLYGGSFLERGMYILKKYLPIIIISYVFIGIVLLISLNFYNNYQQLLPFVNFWLKKMSLISIIIFSLLIINWFLTLFIKISHMIKNKKPVKPTFNITLVVRLIISVVLITSLQQSISTYLSLNNTVSKNDQWALLKNYGYLGIIKSTENNNFSFFDSETEEVQFKRLMERLSSDGAVYIQPSSFYMNESFGSMSYDNIDEQYIEVNTNYLHLNKINDVNSKDVTENDTVDDNNLLTLLIPYKLKHRENEIKELMLSNYKSTFQNELTMKKINIIYVDNNQSYFTFSTNYAQESGFEIEDPIAVVINQNLKPEFLAHNLSTGSSYYFKITNDNYPLEEMRNLLENYNMGHIWSPVSVAYSIIENNLQNKLVAFNFSLMNTVIGLILIIVLQIFSTVSYLEISKEEVTIKWLFGYSLIERHYIYYLMILAFWSLVYMFSFFLASTSLLPYLIILNITIDLIIFTSMLLYKENKMIKTNLSKTI